MTAASTCGRRRMASSARWTRAPPSPRSRPRSDRALEAQLAVLTLDDEGDAVEVPLHGRAQGDEIGALGFHDRLVALLLGEGERADGETLLAERIRGRRKGVAAAETL